MNAKTYHVLLESTEWTPPFVARTSCFSSTVRSTTAGLSLIQPHRRREHGIMAKRLREQELVDDDRLTKRPRPLAVGRLSSLSDELSLRILSHLPVSDLVRCQR